MTTPGPNQPPGPGPMPPEPSAVPVRALDLLTPEEFEGVAATVRDSNPGMEHHLSRRIVAEALAFLSTVAKCPRVGIAPSPAVDEGWHALVLDTLLYARLCTGLGGFIHHRPERPEEATYDATVSGRTLAAMAGCGYAADLSLWVGPEDGGVIVAAKAWHSPQPPPPPTPPAPTSMSDARPMLALPAA
ncbi:MULTISPECIES: hypothetical protein [unclassified Kitasatospora]|uniref:hypothetical protein n=1 Tax=unclassified Kitasatospora TaxID=2633591 RepID=UPI003814FB66